MKMAGLTMGPYNRLTRNVVNATNLQNRLGLRGDSLGAILKLGKELKSLKKTEDPPISPRRSALMGKIRGKNTEPELSVRRLLHKHGYRFRLHAKDLPGRPDIVFRRYRKVIFVHGCFWHRHEGCKQASIPKVRKKFWEKKFEANRRRDTESLSALAEKGWKALVVWECETANKDELLKRLIRFLDDSLS